jgi:hypothetical protein
MPVHVHKEGGFTVTGEKGIKLYTLMSLRSALKLHMVGLKSRMSPIQAAQRMGFKGKTAKALLPEVQAAIDELNPKVARVVEAKRSAYCQKEEHAECANQTCDLVETCDCVCHDGPMEET